MGNEASQNLTCPLVIPEVPAFTDAVSVIAFPDAIVVTTLLPEVIANDVDVATGAAKPRCAPRQTTTASVIKVDHRQNVFPLTNNPHIFLNLEHSSVNLPPSPDTVNNRPSALDRMAHA